MPQLTRHYCSRCARSIFNVEIDGKKIPLVIQMTIGQPADTGEPINVNDPEVKLPHFIREIMHLAQGLQRVELCVACFALVFGLPLVTAEEDEMWIPPSQIDPQSPLRTIPQDPAVDFTQASAALYHRTFHAVEVGRGVKTVKDLPKQFQAPPRPEMPDPLTQRLAAATPEQRQEMIKQLASEGVASAPVPKPRRAARKKRS